MNVRILEVKLVKNNPLIDTGDGRRWHEVIQLGDMVKKYGLQGARAKLAELRAEARRQYAWRQLTSTPRLHRGNHPPRVRAARARAIKASPKAAPKRTTRRSRSKCHGHAPDHGDGAARPNTQPVSLVEGGDQ
jgi:hypothetical protein